MRLRRVASAGTTVLVAVAVALAVPVSQLRTVAVVHECCCPDPDDCHCPDHKDSPSPQSQLRACHSTTQLLISAQAPAFTRPVVAAVELPVLAAEPTIHVIATPHDAPPPARPAAPS